MAPGGRQKGGRRRATTTRKSRVSARVLALAAGITVAIVAWGYLVHAAIDFGTAARAGRAGAWTMLAVASVGAVACLFVGLMLMSRLGAALGLGRPSSPAPEPSPARTTALTAPLRAVTEPAAYPDRPHVPIQRTGHRVAEDRAPHRQAPRGQRVKGGKRAAR